MAYPKPGARSGNPAHRPRPQPAPPPPAAAPTNQADQPAPAGAAPAAAAAAPSSGGGGGGNSNPYYAQLESMYRAQGVAEAAGMRDSIRQMLIGFGLVPGGFNDKFGALDPATKALIAKNTATGISTSARLTEQKKIGQDSLLSRLQGKGLRRSGARGHGLRKNQLNYDRAHADSLSQMMSQIGQMYSGYSQNEYARQAALMQAAMQYYTGSSGSTYGSGGDGGGGGGSTSPSGGNVQTRNVGSSYDNPDGLLYNMNGRWGY